MQNSFNTIAIIGKYMTPNALQNMQVDLVNLAQHLHSRNINVYIEKNTAQNEPINGFKTISLVTLMPTKYTVRHIICQT